MNARTAGPRERLTDLLDKLRPGDEIQAVAASRKTGMDEATCETVLGALARVGLFTRSTDGVFTRCRMFDALDRLQG